MSLMTWFETLLVVATLGSGAVWLLDALFFAKRRKAKGGLLDEEPVLVDYSRAFFPVLAVVLVLRSFIAEPYKIPSSSMMPNLLIGDFILVNKFAYGLRLPITNTKIVPIGLPERGDVAVFKYPGMGPDDPDKGVDFVKRVVGLPGDKVSYHRGVLSINGVPLQYEVDAQAPIGNGSDRLDLPGVIAWEQLGEHRHLVQNYIQSLENGSQGDGEFEVPAGHYLVMGDNRDNSLDGRFWGMLPEANLRGKAFLVWMNFKDFSRIGDRIP